MKVGLVIANHGKNAIENVRLWPSLAEEMGFSTVWFTDHVVGLRAYAPRFSGTWMELLSSLAYASGRTERIRLGTGVMVVPYRNPVYAAKVIATIDQLSNGRVNVGVGIGWSRSEYKALGVGEIFDSRGDYTNEALDVMCRCWAGGQLGFDGGWSKFRKIEFEPASLQRPRPPLWVGGHSGAALRRAAKYADVWHPMAMPFEEYAATAARLDELAGRSVSRTVRILLEAGTATGQLLEQIAGFRDAGCVEVAVDLQTDEDAVFRAAAERLAGVLDKGTLPS
jgi:probable F420-dependent oxidoreductase